MKVKYLGVWLIAIFVCLAHCLLFFLLPIPRTATTWSAFASLHAATLVCALITNVTYAGLGGKNWYFGTLNTWLLGLYWFFAFSLTLVTYIVCSVTEMEAYIVWVVAGLLFLMALVLQLLMRLLRKTALGAESNPNHPD